MGLGPASSSPGSGPTSTAVPASPATGSTTLGRSFGSGGSSDFLTAAVCALARGSSPDAPSATTPAASAASPTASTTSRQPHDVQKLVCAFAPGLLIPMWMWSRCAIVLFTFLRNLPRLV